MFGLSEKQFARYYKEAFRRQGVTGDNMLQMLERRLDTVILRANFARTIMQARQFVGHAHFTVNGRKNNISSFQVSIGDVITIKERMKESPIYKTLLEEFQEFASKNKSATVSTSKWLEIDAKNLTIKVVALPEKGDFDQMIDIQRIIEFYSK